MRVRNIYTLLILFILASSALFHSANGNSFTTGQIKAINIVVSGKILNDSSGKPIINHSIMVKVPYLGYNSTVYTDASGNYADTVHDVPGLGDTLWVSLYDCHSILHIQSQPIQSYSLVINFSVCEKFSPNCIAEFIAEIDSSSIYPNKYKFFDLSAGDPDHWSWDFGDGSSSTERNPAHIYNQSGHFKVCLTVSREHLYSPCSDSSCKFISTPKYHSIGGHVFAGDRPINNPASTGDTAIAYLYKLNNNHLIAFDTLKFTYLGYYSFPHLLSGDYLVKVALTPQSVNAKKFFPTYYIQNLFWQQSKLVDVADTSVFNFDIYLKPCNDSLEGPGRVSGKVERQTPALGIFTLNRSEVLLLDSMKNIITYTLSDGAGNFSFSNLPYGLYQLFVESTGKFSKYTQIRLSVQSPVADTLVLDIYDHNITAVPEIHYTSDIVAGLPFPNPSAGSVSVPLTLHEATELITTVYSMQSIPLLEKHSRPGSGNSMLITDLSPLPNGIYILIIMTPDGSILCREKLIKSR